MLNAMLHLRAFNDIECNAARACYCRCTPFGKQVCRLGLDSTINHFHLHQKAELTMPLKHVVLRWLRCY